MAFHVPERWRDQEHPDLGTTAADGNNGMFRLLSPRGGWMLALICSDGEGWEHVSVHAYRGQNKTVQMRTPQWEEMTFVKDLCWDGEDVVMQLHPRRSQYVNNHPHVLHLWRPLTAVIPEPPALLVGVLTPSAAD